MLVLSRKLGEQVVVGDNIGITVVGIRGKSVRLAFAAPREVPIYREEVYRQQLPNVPVSESLVLMNLVCTKMEGQ